MINLDDLINGLKGSFSQTVQPVLSGLGSTVKSFADTINPVQANAAKIASAIPQYLNAGVQQLSQIKPPSFQGLEPTQIVNKITSFNPMQIISNKPLIPAHQGLGLIDYLSNDPNPASPTIGQYFKAQVLDPIKSGITDIQSPGLLKKGLGALQILGGVFGSTPPGLAFNVGVGAVAGAARSMRTGEDLKKSLSEGIGQPTSIASQGLGVSNPWLAMGLDMAIMSPKESLNTIKGIASRGMNIAENAKALSADAGAVAETVKSKERQLYELLNYENELQKRGFTDSQRANLGIKKAREVLGWTEEAAAAAIEKARTFAEEKKATFDKMFAEWLGNRDVAKTTGTQAAIPYTKIPNAIGWDVIRGLEGKTDIVDEAKPYVAKLRQAFDQLHAEANKAGLDTAYLQQYVTHIYKQSEEQVQATYKAASRQFKFAKERTIPTYDEAIKMGLTPLYTHPAEIIQSYVRKMNETQANLKFFNNMKKEGMIVDAAIGVGKYGFMPITAPGIPPSAAKNAAGELVKGSFYAPELIAKLVNKLFSPEDQTTFGKILDFTARASSRVQDVLLSGGLPYSPLNAFALMAGGQRELLAGRVKSVGNFLESFSQGKMLDWFNEHASSIKEMQRRNIPMNTIYKAENFIDKGVLENIFGGGIGAAWDRAVNEKTFKSYMPSLQVSFFEDVRDAALKQGKGASEALDIAAEAVKKFYGVVSSDTLAKQTKWEQDLKTTLLFAPKFRESLINFWKNNISAISPLHLSTDGGLHIKGNNPFALQNIYNTRFVVGATINYLIFDQLNLRTVGRHLSENPPGTETTLLIPTGSDNKDVIGVPFLSSLGTMPLTAGKMAVHAAQGNGPQVMKDAAGFPSLLLKAPLDVANNENYYGQSIYDVNAPMGDKAKDIAKYMLTNYSHPYVRTAIEMGAVPGFKKKDQPDYAALSKTLELPFRFYTEQSLNGKYYYGAKDKAFNGLTKDQQGMANFKGVADDPTDDTQTRMTKASIRLSQPAILTAETNAAKETALKTKQPLAPFYTLPHSYQLKVLLYNSLPPGNGDKKGILTANPWLSDYWSMSSAYYNANPIKPTTQVTTAVQRPTVTPYVQTQLANKNYGDAQVQDYLNQNTAYTNSERQNLGLPALPSYQRKSYGKKPSIKKLAIKLKGITGTHIKIKPVKLNLKPLSHLKRLKVRVA